MSVRAVVLFEGFGDVSLDGSRHVMPRYPFFAAYFHFFSRYIQGLFRVHMHICTYIPVGYGWNGFRAKQKYSSIHKYGALSRSHTNFVFLVTMYIV